MSASFWTKGEPRLVDVLADPIVKMVMHRDGLTRGDLIAVIDAAKAGLTQPPHRLCGSNGTRFALDRFQQGERAIAV